MTMISNEALYAAIEAVAQSIGLNTTARMHAAIARVNGEGSFTRAELEAKVKEAVDHGAAIIRKMAHDMAKATPGPGGWPLSDGEIAAIERSILVRYMGQVQP